LNLLGVKFYSSVTEFESFLHEGSQFANSTTLVSKDFLCVGSADDNFGSGRGDSDFTARVTLFCEFTSEELVEFSKEHTIGDELQSAFGLQNPEKGI
jgi:hypothetical protein